MLKLYRLSGADKHYWETWEDAPGSHTVHSGELGTNGSTKTVKSTFFTKATDVVQKEIDSLVARGFLPIAPEDHAALIIEYKVDGMGTEADIDKRHRLEARMNETLGWTGLGNCDGGSIGSGSMEVCCFVVDFDLARGVIEADLQNTEFADYVRIYDENTA